MEAFDQTHLGVAWDGVDLVQQGLISRLHCPACKKPNVLRERPGPARGEFICRSCGELTRRPLRLRRKGEVGAGDRQTAASRDNGWMVVDGLLAGHIQACVDKMPAHVKALGMLCCTSEGDDGAAGRLEHLRAILDWMLDDFDRRKVVVPRDWAHAHRVMELVLMLIDDFVARERSGRGKYSRHYLANELGVDNAQFYSGRAWDAICNEITRRLDSSLGTGLGVLAGRLAELRGERDDDVPGLRHLAVAR